MTVAVVKKFIYRAVDSKGAETNGVVEAMDDVSAFQLLKHRQLYPLRVQPDDGAALNHLKPVIKVKHTLLSADETAMYCDMLTPLLAAGATLEKANRFIASAATSKATKTFADAVGLRLSEGQSFPASVEASGAALSTVDLCLLRAADTTGNTAEALKKIAEGFRWRRNLRTKLQSAAIYPAVLLFAASLSLGVVLTVLLPNIEPLFAGREEKIPLALSLLFAIYRSSRETWLLVLASLVLGLGALWLLRSRLVFAQALLLKSNTLRQLEASRFCYGMGVLLQQGQTLQQALRLADQLVRHESSAQQIRTFAGHVVAGASVAESAARDLKFLSPRDCQLLAVAANSNALDKILLHIASVNQDEALRKIEQAVSLFTPVLTLLLGALVGGLVLTVMQAVLRLNSLV